MPLLTIYSLAPARRDDVGPMLLAACAAGAKALACPPGNIWAQFVEIRPGEYVQGETSARALRPGSHPPVVIVRANRGRPLEARRALIVAVADAVGAGLGMNGSDVYVHWQEMEPADVYNAGVFNG